MTTTERTRLLRRRMIASARRATVDHGLAGFTIERLCEDVGVSRRTFFNHFASKEDVVLGIELGAEDDLLDAYADGGVVARDLDPLGSVIAMAIEQIHAVGIDRGDEALVRKVFEREPALVARFVSATDKQLGRVADAVARRFAWTGAAAPDARARLVTEIAAGVLKVTAARFFADDFDEASGPPFDELLTTNLHLARQAVATAAPDKETP